ncbi:MAG: hypothetical protein JST36_04585 [Bacteroidetes bacterium]|nr:hypothetical protein [Bacteroidota bacterium]
MARGTESPQGLEERIAKAELELLDADEFDRIIVNDNLEIATQDLLRTCTRFIHPEGETIA